REAADCRTGQSPDARPVKAMNFARGKPLFMLWENPDVSIDALGEALAALASFRSARARELRHERGRRQAQLALQPVRRAIANIPELQPQSPGRHARGFCMRADRRGILAVP